MDHQQSIDMSATAARSSAQNTLTSLLRSISTIGTAQPPTESQVTTQSLSSLSHLPQYEQAQAKKVLLTLHFLFPHELLPALDLLDRKLVTCLRLSTSVSARAKHDRSGMEPQAGSVQPLTSPMPSNRETLTRNSNSETDKTLDDASIEQMSSNDTKRIELYYIQSSSTAKQPASTTMSSGPTISIGSGGRYRNAYNKIETYYEVDLDSWNCSCPAFAFSSMKLLMLEPVTSEEFSTTINQGHKDSLSPAVDVERGLKNNYGKREWNFGGSATKPDAVVPLCKHILAAALSKASPYLFGHGVHSDEVTQYILAGRSAG